MKRKIGKLEVSEVGLGCNNFGMRLDDVRTAEVVAAALESGINFFDTADVYGGARSEEYLGRALGARRPNVVLATKFGNAGAGIAGGAAPAYVRQALDASLRRLGTDWVDLYQLHRPDPAVPIADTLGALQELVKAGKVREIGCSNFTAEQLREAAAVGGVGFVSVQNEYSILHREPERGVLAECDRAGVAFLPYFPLAGGILTGKYRSNEPHPQGTRLTEPSSRLAGRFLKPEHVSAAESLDAFARQRGHTVLDLAFSWLLSHPAVASVIAGATSVAHVKANVAAAGWSLPADDVAEVDRLAPFHA
ncbi:MAG: aldo/keto reductase [Polyangiaceae bacterium]|nr:aldo/keto reductase [Polyangiaceae bacterium]